MWVSPDEKIRKDIITPGEFGLKPTENSVCSIKLNEIYFKNDRMPSDYLVETDKYPISVIIGEANTVLDREIDKCLQMMYSKEFSSVVINFSDNEVRFVLGLCHFESRGFIYEWDAGYKFSLAQNHKERGVELFKASRYIDASFRFSKGLKLLLSIPVPIEDAPDEIDGINLVEIDQFKVNLYNNLASCNSKAKRYETVIGLCTKVLELDENNVKALLKRGFAYAGTRAFEKARDDLTQVISLDNNNQTAREKLQFVNSNINQQEANFASMVKKMFSK